jgi:hypothetical protein
MRKSVISNRDAFFDRKRAFFLAALGELGPFLLCFLHFMPQQAHLSCSVASVVGAHDPD